MIWLLKYWRYLAVLGILVAVFVSIKYWGHTKYEAGIADAEQRMSAAVAKQAAETARREAEQAAHLNQVVEHFNEQLAARDSTVDGLAKRLRDYQVRNRTLSEAAAAASGTGGSSEVAREDEGAGRTVEAAVQSVFDACRADALQLKAIQEAWPE